MRHPELLCDSLHAHRRTVAGVCRKAKPKRTSRESPPCRVGTLVQNIEGNEHPGDPKAEEDGVKVRSLISTNFRRAFNFGKVYVGIGLVLPLVFIAELSVAGGAAAGSSGGPIIGEIFPLLLPVFVVLGTSGALMIFASDKDKGVYEYMLAYGVDVSTIFWSMIAATVCLVTLILTISLALAVGVLAVTSAGVLSIRFGELILFYSIPLSYAAAMFMSMGGMIWSQLTTRRPGINSPVGMAPLLGIAPVLAVLLLALGPGSGYVLDVVIGASVAMLLAVVAMASVANSKMQSERFLSSA
jgi:hypothetical protein